MSVTTLNTIKNSLAAFASYHLQLKRFQLSFFENFDGFSTSAVQFPILYAIPQDVQLQENINSFTIRVYAVDILQTDRTNEVDVINDTLLILRDLRNWLALADNGLNILNNPIAIPVNNFLVDYTAGWYIDIEVEGNAENNECSIPFSSNFLLSGNSCSYTFIAPYLTCDTLSGCSTILGIQDDITDIYQILATLTGGTSGGNFLPLSGGTLTGPVIGTTFNGTFIGDGSQLTGITATTGVDIYTTGATLDSNTSVATFNRNDGNDYTLDLSFLNVPTLQQVTDSGFQTTNPIYIIGNSLSVGTQQDTFGIQILDINNNDNLTVGVGTNINGQGFITLYNESGATQTTIENGNINTTGQYLGDGSALTGIPNTFTTGATFNAATRIATFNRNDGGTYLLSGITDITITGGTYNNATGTATFRNNTGGTFDVVGFTTGGTSGFDVFVTGGTYNNATGTATFRNNTGGTFNVTGFTTGGTGSVDLTVGTTQINNGRNTNILFQSGTTLLQSNAFNYVASSNTMTLSAGTANLSLRTPNNGLHFFDTGFAGSGYYIGSAPTIGGTNNYLQISPGSIQFFNLPTGARTLFTFNNSPTGNLELGNFANRVRITHSAWATNWEVGGRDGNWGLGSTGTQPALTTRGVFWQEIGVAPVANITDAFQQYAADATTGGTAAPHFRTENGNVIKLYQQNTGTTQATIVHATGTNIKVDDTFDGYTLAQVVRALRNAGLLA
jgi:hypothetical protein